MTAVVRTEPIKNESDLPSKSSDLNCLPVDVVALRSEPKLTGKDKELLCLAKDRDSHIEDSPIIPFNDNLDQGFPALKGKRHALTTRAKASSGT